MVTRAVRREPKQLVFFVMMPLWCHASRWNAICFCRSFDGEARKIAQLLNQMTRDLGGRRDLSKLSPWLANYSPGAVTLLYATRAIPYIMATFIVVRLWRASEFLDDSRTTRRWF